jgi:ComF family protein
MTILDFFFPKRCVGCGAFGRYICLQCEHKIHHVAGNEAICPVCEKPAIGGETHPRCRTRYAPDGLTSFFHYEGIVQKAIKSIKYRYVSDSAAALVGCVDNRSLSRVVENMPSDSVVIPIPLHQSRMRYRGFNQADILARHFVARVCLTSTHLNIAVRADILKRLYATIAQVDMRDKKERLKNMHGVFVLRERAYVKGMHILLFDDVFTTGATIRAATNTLKRAGAESVWAITIAR